MKHSARFYRACSRRQFFGISCCGIGYLALTDLIGAEPPSSVDGKMPEIDRCDILRRMQLVMGDFPDAKRRVPLDMKVEKEFDEGERIRRLVTFTTEPGDRAVAWLMIPKKRPRSGQKFPAMLCLHQTTRIGKDEPAGLGGSPNLHYAAELTARGYVTLSPDYPNFGQYQVDCYKIGYASASMKGIWNHSRAVDLLAGLKEVDADRLGVIGHSLGGHNALFVDL